MNISIMLACYNFFTKKRSCMKKSLCSMLFIFALLFPMESIAKKKKFKGKQDTFDYIIVGFGSAGAILSRKLSDNFKTSVLVLEAGPNNMEDPSTLNPNI